MTSNVYKIMKKEMKSHMFSPNFDSVRILISLVER